MHSHSVWCISWTACGIVQFVYTTLAVTVRIMHDSSNMIGNASFAFFISHADQWPKIATAATIHALSCRCPVKTKTFHELRKAALFPAVGTVNTSVYVINSKSVNLFNQILETHGFHWTATCATSRLGVKHLYDPELYLDIQVILQPCVYILSNYTCSVTGHLCIRRQTV